ncbi:hypothetical protein [Roseiconus lacunae]|uniref:hypothetical protein n=1 Tax=Roseiconus lacunae TaxID=2605694 RepID=UPI0011F37669|nr:hypothetical protein [Roseiconus lacunae]
MSFSFSLTRPIRAAVGLAVITWAMSIEAVHAQNQSNRIPEIVIMLGPDAKENRFINAWDIQKVLEVIYGPTLNGTNIRVDTKTKLPTSIESVFVATYPAQWGDEKIASFKEECRNKALLFGVGVGDITAVEKNSTTGDNPFHSNASGDPFADGPSGHMWLRVGVGNMGDLQNEMQQCIAIANAFDRRQPRIDLFHLDRVPGFDPFGASPNAGITKPLRQAPSENQTQANRPLNNRRPPVNKRPASNDPFMGPMGSSDPFGGPSGNDDPFGGNPFGRDAHGGNASGNLSSARQASIAERQLEAVKKKLSALRTQFNSVSTDEERDQVRQRGKDAIGECVRLLQKRHQAQINALNEQLLELKKRVEVSSNTEQQQADLLEKLFPKED